MESKLSPDTEKVTPPVPLKTYQWEDLRRARKAGAYPWTHLLKVPLEGEITAEDIIRESSPRRSMSREFSRSRTHSPDDRDVQKILNLDSSPGSSRKHGEEGEDEGVHIPNFSKEVSVDEEDKIVQAVSAYVVQRPESQASTHLTTPIEIPKNASPKGILKRRVPDHQHVSITETRDKTKCCHPLVNKIKHLADKTLQKLDRNENEKSPQAKRKKNEELQEIRQLKSSPGAVRRQKFGAIKLGDSDEMSKTLCIETPPPRKKKDHIYEDIEEKPNDPGKSLHFADDVELNDVKKSLDDGGSQKENDSIAEKKSNASQDPSLVTDDNNSLKQEEHVMEKLHIIAEPIKQEEPVDELDQDEPNVDEIFETQFEETRPKNDSPNITITEIVDEDSEMTVEENNSIPIETSPSPSPRQLNRQTSDVEFASNEWSKPSSDHEYEIIEKPPPNIVFNTPSIIPQKSTMVKSDDELSSTTSLERKYLQHNSDEEDQAEYKENLSDTKNEDLVNAEALQKDIEDRYFLNTPSTVSRTECEISTSQVDSSALENLPLKRENRSKNAESVDSKIQQRIKEGTGKLKSQAGKLKTKLKNIKAKQFSMPERPRINLPDRPKFSFPERPKFNLPDKRKFSLPERPKFKINFAERLNFGDRKFTMPERPKFNVPDLSKFKLPERPKINFPSLGKKKAYKVEVVTTDSSPDLRNADVATVDFEIKTYPRLMGKKKKTEIPKTSSSPTLNRDDTPPPTFTFTRMKKKSNDDQAYIPDSPEQPREYGNITEPNYEEEIDNEKHFETTYDFDKLDSEYIDETEQSNMNDNRNANSIPDISPSKQEYTHINEINNDEFFVRPRGISRENIQVREYLSDEIRQAFNIPKNVLATMGSNSRFHDENVYVNAPADADPELMIDDNEQLGYSTEDINERDDGYYTFPPVRPSRAKRKRKEQESIQYIDDSVNASVQFSDVDLGLAEQDINTEICHHNNIQNETEDFSPTDLHSIHEYANDDVIEYPDNIPLQSQTLPMPPKRKKKGSSQKDLRPSASIDFKQLSSSPAWEESLEQPQDLIVYRTEHEYVIAQGENTATEQSPIPPRRNRSRSSRATSFCDDDRTSHGAESLTLDTHAIHTDVDVEREIRHESPGYATVDKGQYAPSKGARRSKSKTPPARRKKSNSSERKYYTVGPNKPVAPDRPPRKKSSTSLTTLDSFAKRSISADLTQYVEIDEPEFEEIHKDLKSGEVVSKMKDRPLPPPPRPPRGPKRTKRNKEVESNKMEDVSKTENQVTSEFNNLNLNRDIDYGNEECKDEDIVEIEVSTQTDPLPDDVDYELGLDENIDVSMSSSLRDIVDDDSIVHRGQYKLYESPRVSRPTSRSDKSLKLSDPKISDLSKTNIGRTSPTVILVERRVSSPTRINERDEMLTEASLTVQHIDIDESQIPDVPPLPKSRSTPTESKSSKTLPPAVEDRALERITDTSRDVMLDSLITQRLQVRDLDVGRLNVSELQASKILVSDIEGMTLQVTELDSKSGHISVSGIEFSQSVIDEIVKKFAEITTAQPQNANVQHVCESQPRPVSREEHTQTEVATETENLEAPITKEGSKVDLQAAPPLPPPPESAQQGAAPAPPPRPPPVEESVQPPQRPPPPDLTPLLYSYLQDITFPPPTYYGSRQMRERAFPEPHESHPSPPPPARRAKRKPAAPHSESSSEEARPRPSPRRMPPPVRVHEPSITEAGAQFLRVCHSSVTRVMRNIFNSFMSYVSGTEDKRDMQMALVIFLVLVAGLIMFGLSDSRTVHHHHWEFFNPPDGKQ